MIEPVTRVAPKFQGLIQLPVSGRWVRPVHQKDPEASQTQTAYVLFDKATGEYVDSRGNRAKKRHDLTEPFPSWEEAEDHRNKLCLNRLSCDCVSTQAANLQ